MESSLLVTGGGHKRLYRVIDFRRDKHSIPAKVVSVEYDPNRNARISLLHYQDGEKRYILHPANLKVGMVIRSGPDAPIEVGNALPLGNIPLVLPFTTLARARTGRANCASCWS